MRNLKKRILSFVSAVAMVATLLPSTALFASAASDFEVSFDVVQNGSTDVDVNVTSAGEYEVYVKYQGNDDSWGGISRHVKISDGSTALLDTDVSWNIGGGSDWSNWMELKAGTVTLEAKTYTATVTMDGSYGKSNGLVFKAVGGSTGLTGTAVGSSATNLEGEDATTQSGSVKTGEVSALVNSASNGAYTYIGQSSLIYIPFYVETTGEYSVEAIATSNTSAKNGTFAISTSTSTSNPVTSKSISVTATSNANWNTFTVDDSVTLTSGTQYYAIVETGSASADYNFSFDCFTVTLKGSTSEESSSQAESSSESETTTTTITLKSEDYESLGYYYEDTAGNCYAVPFDFTTGVGDVTVKITSGSGYANIFGPSGMSVSGLSGGNSGDCSNGKSGTITSSVAPWMYYSESGREGIISSSSPSGRYFVAMSGSTSCTIEITYPDGAVTIISTESDGNYNVSVVPSSTNGGTVGTLSETTYEPGSVVTLPTATASSGYTFMGWRDAKGNAPATAEDGSYTYTLPEVDSTAKTANVVYTAVFEKNYSTVRDLPIVSVTTRNDETSDIKDYGIDSWVSVTNTDRSIALPLSGNSAEFRGRGNSTWDLGVTTGKKPYRLKFDSKTQMLDGTSKNKKWVLLANITDTTLLRNQIAFQFSKEYLTNIPFTTSIQQVELYVNGEYEGVYLLCEQTEAASGRADIGTFDDGADYDSAYNPTDDELGFLIELDAEAATNNEEFYFGTDSYNGKSRYFTVKAGAISNPDGGSVYQTNSDNQYVSVIKTYVDKVSSAISSGDETTIRSYIDVDSFVDMYLLQELAKNCDVGAASFYLTKTPGQKLQASPPWDFDRCFGNDSRCSKTSGLYVANGTVDSGSNDNASKWFNELCSQTWFVNAIKARFTSLYNAGAFDSITTNFDWDYWKNSAAVAANVDVYGTDKNFDYYGKVGSKGDYNAEVDFLYNWIVGRISTLKSAYYDSSIVTTTYTVTATSANETMGTVSPATQEINENANATVTATANSGYKFVGWYDSSDTLVSSVASYTFKVTADTVLTAKFEESTTNTVTLNSEKYTSLDLYYDEGGKNRYAVPFDFVSGIGDVTVEVTSGSGYLNVFGPDGMSLSGDFDDIIAYDKGGSLANVENVSKHAYKNGGTTFTINSSSASDRYYVAMSETENCTIKITYPDGAVKVVTITTKYTISATANPEKGGAISGTGKYDEGSTIKLTAVPSAGYKFTSWTLNNEVVGTEATLQVTVDANKEYVAKFDLATYDITVKSSNESMGTVKSTSANNNYTLTASPADSYKFVRWTDEKGNFISNVADYEFTATSDATYIAEFEKITGPSSEGKGQNSYRFEAEDSGNYIDFDGKITYHTSDDYSEASNQIIRLDKDGEGNIYIPFSLAEGDDGTYTFTAAYVNSQWNTADFAVFVEDESGSYTINGVKYSKVGDTDSLGYVTDTDRYNTQTTTRTLTGGKNYLIRLRSGRYAAFDYVDVTAPDGLTPFGGGSTVNISASCNEAFGTVNGGTASYSGTVTYNSQFTLTATAVDGYRFVSWTKDGKVVSKDANYTITADSDAAYVANFGKIEWIILEAENFTEFQTENQNASGETDRIWDVTDVEADVTAELPNADYKKYTDTMFSGGQAVNLTKNSSAVGIPFTVTDQAINYGDLDVILGYDWGNMDENHTDESGSESGLWVNIYVPLNGASTMSDADKAIWGAAGWRTDGGSLANSSDYAEGYYILYRRLNPNKTEMTVTIPHEADPGNYILAVATDTWNGSQTSINGTGYYDYIKFPAGTNEGIVVGATFFFTDMFGNTLRSSEYSDTSYEDGTVYFSPKVPRYLLTQGYDIVRWEYTDPDGNSAVVDLTNTDFDSPSAAIEALKYPAGSNVTFKAVYEVAEGAYDVSVKNGRMYVMDPDTQEYTIQLEKSNTYRVQNFGKIKLVADTKANEEFDHWELNGFIYSYDKEIMFSTWTDANFEAVYETEASTAQPVAFVDENVVVTGFETEDTNLHKITFDCAYYVPDGYSAYKIGIYYSGDPGKANLEALAGTTVKLSGAPTTPTKCARLDINYNMLVNNQSMVSIYGSPSYKNRSALAFIIYTDSNGDYYITYSGRVATSEVPEA